MPRWQLLWTSRRRWSGHPLAALLLLPPHQLRCTRPSHQRRRCRPELQIRASPALPRQRRGSGAHILLPARARWGRRCIAQHGLDSLALRRRAGLCGRGTGRRWRTVGKVSWRWPPRPGCSRRLVARRSRVQLWHPAIKCRSRRRNITTLSTQVPARAASMLRNSSLVMREARVATERITRWEVTATTHLLPRHSPARLGHP
mmetsp:Transcript_78228/g.253357  ORF Transcript_78228/g.253357 Transcript_78228/m.253357 type:complete len:202 (-) Transcript_78228:1939-2544(-)